MAMMSFLPVSLSLVADTASAIATVRDYVVPTMKTLTAIAAIASVFFITYSGFLYMTSTGRPDKLEHAKRIMKNALIGLVIVLGAWALTGILSGAMVHPTAPSAATLPNITTITPAAPSNGLIDIMISAVTGFINVIIQTIGKPFLDALTFFTTATPHMTDNPAVFNFWLAMVGITDVLFVLAVALVGFRVMSASTFGFDDVDLKTLLPQVGLVFLLLNISIFIIDGLIELSNVLINAVNAIGGNQSVWGVLTGIVGQSGGQSVAALLIMLAFLILAIILLVYYVGRLVTLFLGAVLSPIVILIWLIPSFRDFSETAIKTYITTIFILFVHVVILQLAASLFVGMAAAPAGSDGVPNVLMAMILGLATVIALLKTQGLMMQLSFVGMGARSTRRLGSTFMNGVSYLGGRSKAAVSTVSNKLSSRGSTNTSSSSNSPSKSKSRGVQVVRYAQPSNSRTTPNRTQKTGTTYNAPSPSSSKTRSDIKTEAASKTTKKNAQKEEEKQ